MVIWYQIIFWLAVGLILYTFLGYAWLIGLVARYKSRPVQQAAITPSVTLLIPAYNEASVIARKIKNSLALNYPADSLEIIVVADGSDDETVDIVATYEKVRLYHQLKRQGKAAAINRVMPLVSSEIVIFSDANAMLEAEALRMAVSNFADPAVGGVAGEKQVTAGGEGLYWRYESYLKRCDSSLSSVMGAAGELFAIRRELFQPPEADSVIEDFVMSLRLVESGWRVVYEPRAVVREEALFSLRGEWQRRTRIAAGGFQSIWRLSGLLNPAHGWVTWQYISHRVLRWAVTPFLLPAVYLLNVLLLDLSIYRLIWVGQTIFYGAALLGYGLARREGKQRGPLYTIFYFCFTNAAAWIGFWRFVTGTQPVTWVKAR